MSDTKYTPGPWEAQWTHKNTLGGRTYGWHVGQPDTDNTVCLIEDERGCDTDHDRREADANLIAAAPDMLAVLARVTNKPREADRSVRLTPADLSLLHDAIAKARGE